MVNILTFTVHNLDKTLRKLSCTKLEPFLKSSTFCFTSNTICLNKADFVAHIFTSFWLFYTLLFGIIMIFLERKIICFHITASLLHLYSGSQLSLQESQVLLEYSKSTPRKIKFTGSKSRHNIKKCAL